uniref:Ig-like domain-containing protein n=2 Tax=Esox lucius TaxID=8010 RepID=A0A3P8YVD0_ESOLU
MALATKECLLVVFLWSLTVVLGQNGWGVTYYTQSICALKGSTVELSCTYKYPSGLQITSAFWFTKGPNDDPVNLMEDPDYKDRVIYHSDDENGHKLTIKDLRKSDSAVYKSRFFTVGYKYTGLPGVNLSVTDLQVNMTAATVTDGGSVNLTCNTTCTLIGHTYIWYRNKQLLTNQEVSLHLNPVSSEDAGNYSCAVKGLESLLSPEKKL